MSLTSVMNTSVSGMNAQANKLSTVGDNIANATTTGYKSVSTEFSTLVNSSGSSSSYASGSVSTTVTSTVGTSSSSTSTSSATDLYIDGDGYFVVEDAEGARYLTRSGSFTVDEDGYLVNASGYKLCGTLSGGSYSVNDIYSLDVIQIDTGSMSSTATSSGTLTVNLDEDADAVDTDDETPADNDAASTYTFKTSVTVYDESGSEVTLDVYYTKTDDDTWEMTVYDADDSTDGGFPYSSDALLTTTLTFDTDGTLSSSGSLSIALSDDQTITLDISDSTQKASDSEVTEVDTDGNAAASYDSVEIGSDGTISIVYDSGDSEAVAQIVLASVDSDAGLEAVSGTAWAVSKEAGSVLLGTAGSGGFGSIDDEALEDSDVDLATQLTDMIVAQRNYTANTKVFQTASEVLQELVNLKR